MPAIAALSDSLTFFACHACFYAVFVPRWLLRQRESLAKVVCKDTGAAAAPARGSHLPLALHALALGALYLGIDAALLGAAPRFLVPPQRAAGALTMLAGAALAAWALAVFKSWRLQARIGPRHELCTAGP